MGSRVKSSNSATSSGWVPQHHRDITLNRLQGFTAGDNWHPQCNIRKNLWLRRSNAAVSLEVWSAPPGLRHPSFDEVQKQQFKPCKVGDAFGPTWSTHWFRVRVNVPEDWAAIAAEADARAAAAAAPGGGSAAGSGRDGAGVSGRAQEPAGAQPGARGADAATPLVFVWDSGSEAMVWSAEGQPMQGITDNRNEYVLSPTVPPAGSTFTIYVEMACNTMTGPIMPPPTDASFTLKAAEVALPNMVVQQLLYDFQALADVASSLPADSATGSEALFVANRIINTYRDEDPDSWVAARALALKFLGAKGATSRHKVYAVGHCHIDTAWLWPFEETHRKVARSWSSQLVLMDRYPQHLFTASSAQQYEWLQRDYPSVFERVRAAASAGRFIPTGGTWVEMDANLPSGESLVRQFLFGQRFFEAQFGRRCEVFWLPDTFGYAAQLPQIMQGAGLKYFLTQKLSWNNINTFPHNTFLWESLDGTSVLTHFPPANTYCSQANVNDLMASANNNRDKDRAPISLMLFGNGDGGGGPTAAMCESLQRLGDAEGRGVDGLVPLVQASPDLFFKELEASSHDLLTWRGELYFELHRGTYTSHAPNKTCNRRCELLLREVEMLWALAAVLAGASYPHEELAPIWKDVLLFQFHDVLPGSAIGMVYALTARRYPEMLQQLQQLRSKAMAAIVQAVAAPAPAPLSAQAAAADGATTADAASGAAEPLLPLDAILGARLALEAPLPGQQACHGAITSGGTSGITSGGGGAPGPWVFNSLSFPRTEVVEVPAALVPPGSAVQQHSTTGNALVHVTTPPLSFSPVFAASAPASPSPAMAGCGVRAAKEVLASGETVYCLSNDLVRAVIDSDGRLVSLFDLQWQRELVEPGQKANRFRYYDDQPIFWDAWDVEVYHLEKAWDAGVAESVTMLEQGPLRVSLQVQVPLSGTSYMTQTISLTAHSARVDFHTIIDWHEDHKVLKVEFPWELRSDSATYETQFGAVSRPTHQNTSWDWAKFEVCAHRFADLSEPDYGVALLNDCKYGHATHGGTQRLTLLRAPKAPDADTDMGKHEFRYALLPHAMGWQAGGVVQAAAALNSPLLLMAAPDMIRGAAVAAAAAADRQQPQQLQHGQMPCTPGSHAPAGSYTSGSVPAAAPVAAAAQAAPRLFWLESASAAPLLRVVPVGPQPHAGSPGLIIDTVKVAELPIAPAAPAAAASGRQQQAGPAADAQQLQLQLQQQQQQQQQQDLVPLVVRLYEPHGCRGSVRLEWGPGLKVQKVVECNLMEDEAEPEDQQHVQYGSTVTQHGVLIKYGPYKVITVKLYVQQHAKA